MGSKQRLTCFFFALCARPMADTFLRLLCPVIAVALLVDQAAAVDTVELEATVACDQVVAVSFKMVSMIGLSASMVEGGSGGVFMFC